MDDISQDLRDAWRAMRRNRGVSAGIVLVPALELTAAGRRQLSAERSKWSELSEAIGRILASPAGSAS
jgi:hypothetical protein